LLTTLCVKIASVVRILINLLFPSLQLHLVDFLKQLTKLWVWHKTSGKWGIISDTCEDRRTSATAPVIELIKLHTWLIKKRS